MNKHQLFAASTRGQGHLRSGPMAAGKPSPLLGTFDWKRKRHKNTGLGGSGSGHRDAQPEISPCTFLPFIRSNGTKAAPRSLGWRPGKPQWRGPHGGPARTKQLWDPGHPPAPATWSELLSQLPKRKHRMFSLAASINGKSSPSLAEGRQ